jgi:hypothetical protein
MNLQMSYKPKERKTLLIQQKLNALQYLHVGACETLDIQLLSRLWGGNFETPPFSLFIIIFSFNSMVYNLCSWNRIDNTFYA